MDVGIHSNHVVDTQKETMSLHQIMNIYINTTSNVDSTVRQNCN